MHLSYKGVNYGDPDKDQDGFILESTSYRIFDISRDTSDHLEASRGIIDGFAEVGVELPKFCISFSQRGFEVYKHYIGQHLDPLNYLDLPQVDRWWISALLYADSRIEKFLLSHFASFRSSGSFPTAELCIPEGLHYPSVIHEVLASSIP